MGLLSTTGSNLSAQDEKLTKEEIQELKEYFDWEQSTFKNPIINPQYNNSENLKAVNKKSHGKNKLPFLWMYMTKF